MTDFLTNAHSGWQYIVLIAVVIAIVVSIRSGTAWPGSGARIYAYAAIAVDIQVLLGILLWVTASGWDAGFAQGWLHPIAGLAALGAVHAFIGRARTAADATSHRLVRTGFIIGIVLVLAAIALAEAF